MRTHPHTVSTHARISGAPRKPSTQRPPLQASMASSIQILFKPKVEQQGNIETKTETELDSAACAASSIAIKQDKAHGNAEKASHLVRFGAVSVGGIASTHAFFNTENIDPCSGSASIALSIQSAAGLGRAKVGKRKSSRGSKKVPIKVFSADAANFMAMVHKLTGLQSAPYLLTGSPQTPLLKPLPARPSHPFMQGMYTPGASAFPAGDKVTANLSADDSFSNALSQLKSSLGQSRHLESFSNASLATKRGSNTESSTDRLPPSIHSPSFKASHPQVLQNSNSSGPSSRVAFLPSLWDPMTEDSSKEKSCTDAFNEHEMLHEDTSGEGHGIGSPDPRTRREALNWEGLVAGEGGSLSMGLSSLPRSYGW